MLYADRIRDEIALDKSELVQIVLKAMIEVLGDPFDSDTEAFRLNHIDYRSRPYLHIT